MKMWLRAGMALCIAFTPATTLGQQQSKKDVGESATTATVASSEEAGEIRIRGTYVLEVRNADGSLASRREFKNAFVGASVLTNLLLGGQATGLRVAFTSDSSFPPPCLGAVCELFTPETAAGQAADGISRFATLQRTAIDGGWRLSGSFKVTASPSGSNIARVQAFIVAGRDPSSALPRGLSGSLAPLLFTEAVINPPERVQLGQIVQFTYNLLFF